MNEKLKRAHIRVINGNPFFAYLALYLKFREDIKEKPELPPYAPMGVNKNGEIVYDNPKIQDTDDEILVTMLTHEILHLGLLHLLRLGTKQKKRWNIATDLAVNEILFKNGFTLSKTIKDICYNNSISFGKKMITDLDKKSADELYDELPEFKEDFEEPNWRFDDHKEGDSGDQSGKGEADKSEQENEWMDKVEAAYICAKQLGNVPKGVEQYIEGLKKVKVDWKALLRKHILAAFPTDYTWQKRSKKSVALGPKVYLPSVYKEKVDVCIGIDTSGSIQGEELSEFMSEIISIAKAYQNNVNMRILAHDVDVQIDETVTDATEEKIKKIKVLGGGGTSHKPLLKYVQDKVKGCKCLVMFTDGYSDIQSINLSKYPFSKIFIISKRGTNPFQEGTEGKLRLGLDTIVIKLSEKK